MSASVSTYTKLITSEHNQRPNFMAMIAATVQPSVDTQNLLAGFAQLFDLDSATGDQLDKLGEWIGVSRNLIITIPTYPIVTTLFIDNFTRANENPLNPANYTSLGSLPLGLKNLQVLSDQCVGTQAGALSIEYYSGASISADQFSQIMIGENIGSGNSYVAMVRFRNLVGQWAYIATATSTGIALSTLGGDALGAWIGTVPPNSVMRLAITGFTLTVTLNQVVVLVVADGAHPLLSFGFPGFGVESPTAIGDASITNFQCGSFTEVDISSLQDADYRILLKLFVAMNEWNGTVPGIYSIWNSIFASEGYQIVVQDNQDMTMTVVFLNPPFDTVILALLTEGYFLLRPAGVGITGFYQPSGNGPIFGFDIENSLVAGWDVGYLMILIQT